MAVLPRNVSTGLRLEPFRAADAAEVAGWPLTAQDVRWLAPQTPPPLTAMKILAWQGMGRQGYMLRSDERDVAYGELNLLAGSNRVWWLGHLLVDPRLRRRGYGRELVNRLLRRGFDLCGAERITLVVFPENQTAISCYRSVGMIDDGYETHTFGHTGEQVSLLRMATRGP